MTFDPLEAYLKFIWDSPLSALAIPLRAIKDFGPNITSLILHREGEFQAELFLVPRQWNTTLLATPNPNLAPAPSAKQHRHPNVDSFELHLFGDITFLLNGKSIPAPGYGTTLRIKPTDWHGAAFGDTGGAFISVQRWLNNVPPTSVGDDWQGETPTPTQELKEPLK